MRKTSGEKRSAVRVRLGNRSLQDLVASERETRAEADALKWEIKRRMLEACAVRSGYVYRVQEGRYQGRRLLVSQVIVEPAYRFGEGGGFIVTLHGVLNNSQSTVRDGFNIKHVVLWGSDQVDLSTEKKGPRDYEQWRHLEGENEEDEDEDDQ